MSLAFFTNNHISGEIRARQIGEYLGEKVDQVEGVEDDVHVLVKTVDTKGLKARKVYVDVLDAMEMRHLLLDHPDFGVVAFTKASRDDLAYVLGRGVNYIPQHHCNFDREVRDAGRGVGVVGYIGGTHAIGRHLEEVAEALQAAGFAFKALLIRGSKGVSRAQVVEFYRGVDVQVYYRDRYRTLDGYYKDSLKFLNAASFKIPTVAVVGRTANEVMRGGGLVEVGHTGEMVEWCERLRKDRYLYEDVAAWSHSVTEEFHISNIAPLYNGLE